MQAAKPVLNKAARYACLTMGVLLFLSAIWVVVFQLRGNPQIDPTAEPEASVSNTVAEKTTVRPYKSPIDFKALKKKNPDIKAWLSIPGLRVEEPVVCREGDDSYYLRRNLKGQHSMAGTLFFEGRNSPDFSDTVTIIYGHNMHDGTMFGELQNSYSNPEFFKKHNTFTVFTPTARLDYKIFAAVPYGNEHILYYHDFNDPAVLQGFIEDILETRSLSANIDRQTKISDKDRIVILSTCFDSDKTQRYLVLGVNTSHSNNK